VAAPARITAPIASPAIAEMPRDFEGEDEVTRMADAGALAGAFSQAFGGAQEEASPLSMPGDEWFVGINGVPVGPIRLSELRSKAASGAVNKESLVWRDGFEDWRPLKTYPELLAIVEEGVSSARASLTPFTPSAAEAREMTAKAPAVTATEAALGSASPSAVTGSAVVTDDIGAVLPHRRGTSPMVWIAMVIAIALGLTLGFVLFGGKPAETKIVEKIVEKEVHVKDPGAPVAANDGAGTQVTADPQAPKKSGSSGKAAPVASTGEAKPNTGLSGLSGLSGLGPSSGPATGGPAGNTSGGGQLDSGQIQSTVARYTGSVKRRCWQPALDARAKDAPMTAKVTVTITVGGTGSVQSATTTSDPRGYPGLGNCIASSVRSWQFPPAGGTTVAAVPFVFAGQ
jgi:GYF domain 2